MAPSCSAIGSCSSIKAKTANRRARQSLSAFKFLQGTAEREGHMTIGKKIAAGFGVALILLLFIGVISFWNTANSLADARWVSHTHEVLENLEKLLSLMKDTQLGLRGYLLTGKEEFLAPH